MINNVVDIEVGVEEEVILTGIMEEVGAVINKMVVQVKVYKICILLLNNKI